jgi:hypothetical protein
MKNVQTVQHEKEFKIEYTDDIAPILSLEFKKTPPETVVLMLEGLQYGYTVCCTVIQIYHITNLFMKHSSA